MDHLSAVLQGLFAIPVVAGSAFCLLAVGAAWVFSRRRPDRLADAECPPLSLLKPIFGLEKELEENLRSCCEQDYPDYQVVMAVQRREEPALPLLRRLQDEYGSDRVTITIAAGQPTGNGRMHNLANGEKAARHDLIVISDSDICLRPEYLRIMAAPLLDPEVGYVCSLYRGVRAEKWYERIEQLSLHLFTTQIVFAVLTGASDFCTGSSVALRRRDLHRIGGFEDLAPYLVDDYEMGQRLQGLGLRLHLAPDFVDTVVGLDSVREWWTHQIYWDQNTWAARPLGFLATVLIQPIPFALAFAIARTFDAFGWAVLAGTIGVRLVSTGAVSLLLRDREATRNLAWLPLRDLTGLATWILTLVRRKVVWRGIAYDLGDDGLMTIRGQQDAEAAPNAAGPAISDLEP